MDPHEFTADQILEMVEDIWEHRQRKGITKREAGKLLRHANYVAAELVRMHKADAVVAGVAQHYPDTIRPALQLLHKKPGVKRVAALFALMFKDKTVFLADTAVNVDNNEAEDLAETAILSADTVKQHFGIEPRVAMLSFSNFGSVIHPEAQKMARGHGDR